MNSETLAIRVLSLMLPDNDVLSGDLLERRRQGKSVLWLWRQVIEAIMTDLWTSVRNDPIEAFKRLSVPWGALLFVYAVFESTVAEPLLDASRQSHQSLVFQGPAWVTSYVGFAVSAWIVARFSRSARLVLLYVGSVWIAMVVAAGIVAFRAPSPTYVPHIFFPLVAVTLPYQWRSGFVLAPILMLIAGMRGSRQRVRA